MEERNTDDTRYEPSIPGLRLYSKRILFLAFKLLQIRRADVCAFDFTAAGFG